MNEHLKRIMDDGMVQLTDAKKKADEALAKAKRDMGTLVEFAETLPQRMLDKMSHVFVGQLDYRDGSFSRPEEAYVQIGGVQEHFIRYDSVRKLDPMKGKYRVIVVLQKMD
jgi:urate oxidase